MPSPNLPEDDAEGGRFSLLWSMDSADIGGNIERPCLRKLRIGLDVGNVERQLKANSIAALPARRKSVAIECNHVMSGGMPGRVGGFVYTGTRHSLTCLKFFSHSFSPGCSGGSEYVGVAPPFERHMVHPVALQPILVAFALNPQPYFVFDEKSRVAIRRKFSLEFERVCFERDLEAPAPGDEGAYE